MRGYIRRRGTGSWQISVELPVDPVTGERRRTFRSVKGTKRDAERELTALSRSVDTGLCIEPNRLTVADYLLRWLRDYALANVAPRTYERYAEVVRLHLVPSLGALTLQSLRPAHIVEAEREWLSRLAPGTALKHHRLLHESLQHAVRWQLLAVNPASAVTPPRQPRREMRALDTEQARALLAAAAGTEFDCAITTLLYTGLRLGELLGLRWADVDLDRGRLHVQQTLQRMTGGGLRLTSTKTPRSRRLVDLPSPAVDSLREHRRRQAEARLLAGEVWSGSGLVFTDGLGRPISATRLRLAYWRLLESCGLPRIRLHDLRHTMATLMLAAGEHPKIVSERLGHATVGITLDTYSHVLPGLGRAAADRLGETLGGGR